MSTGFNGTPMPSFADSLTPEQRWAITDFIVSLSGSNGPGYTNLVIAKHVQDPIDLAKGDRQLRIRSCRALSDHRPDHGAGPRVPSACDEPHGSGDLRCGLHRPPRAMARHERAEGGKERAVAARATGGGRGSRPATAGRARAPAAGRRSLRPGRRQPGWPGGCRPVCVGLG